MTFTRLSLTVGVLLIALLAIPLAASSHPSDGTIYRIRFNRADFDAYLLHANEFHRSLANPDPIGLNAQAGKPIASTDYRTTTPYEFTVTVNSRGQVGISNYHKLATEPVFKDGFYPQIITGCEGPPDATDPPFCGTPFDRH